MIRAATFRPLVRVVCVLLAGCGTDEGALTVGEQSTSAVKTATTSVEVTTSTTLAIEVPTTVAPLVTIPAPDGFPTQEELASRISPFLDPIDAQITSFLAVYGDEEDLAALEIEGGVVESMTIAYLGDLTVWDYEDGFREVGLGGEYLYLSEDGTWLESERFEWPPFGPLAEWRFAQSIASGFFEVDHEVVGFEAVAGIPTLHLALVADEGSADAWIDASGLVMKLITEFAEEGTSLRIQTVWEVTGLNVQPEGPLPPGA